MIKKNRVQKLMLTLLLLAPQAAMAINVAWMGPRSLAQYSPEEREAYEWHLEQARQKRREELQAQRQVQLQQRDQLLERLRADRIQREAGQEPLEAQREVAQQHQAEQEQPEATQSVGSAPKKNSKIKYWVVV
jgi:Skp family chaperone for outer membrane proteins